MRMAGHRHRAHERSIRRSGARARIEGISSSRISHDAKHGIGELRYVETQIILQIEVKAVPTDKTDIMDSDQSRKIRRVSQADPMTFGGHPQPSLDVPYEVTISNKMCFYAITIMKAYQNYSFEELRFMSPAVKRASESMLVRPNGDGSYSATWTPSTVGWYSLMITVDGYNMEDVRKHFFQRYSRYSELS